MTELDDDTLIESIAKTMHVLLMIQQPDMYGTWEEEVEANKRHPEFTYIQSMRDDAKALIKRIRRTNSKGV